MPPLAKTRCGETQNPADRSEQASNQLRTAYWRYLYVRACHNAREGYAVVWINDVELEKARAAVKRVEQKLTKDDPRIDTGSQFDDVSKKLPATIYEMDCHPVFNALLASAPNVPEAKDF